MIAKRIPASKFWAFRKEIWKYYRMHRRKFPWRETKDPYRILVSEIMLQQTQAGRVISKYEEFIRKFPNFSALNKASLKDVLKTWQGLGYNRRALHLKAIARDVVERFSGKLPHDAKTLINLPGIGQSTAGAARTFAFNKPEIFIETNIRTVLIHHFFEVADKRGTYAPACRTGRDYRGKIRDSEIISLVKKTLDLKRPREWYWALMDYGAMLKKLHGNYAARRSTIYAKQSPFAGSTREKRSKILKVILGGKTTLGALRAETGFPEKTLIRHLADLINEGFIEQKGRIYYVSKG